MTPAARRSALADELAHVARRLARGAGALEFGPPVECVYDPLAYAREPHEAYLALARPRPELLLVGMNPGPFGMAQTGVPFGEVAIVRDWLGIAGRVGKPLREHAKRPVEGFRCRRSEVSGARLWGWARARFGTPRACFERLFVWNWCPLAFVGKSGANVTPDKLQAGELARLSVLCDRALRECVEALGPRAVVGVGVFAAQRARLALAQDRELAALVRGSILHPSPASPAANRGWAAQAERQLADLGIELGGALNRRASRSPS
jgi:single-strand selective monofunctional uracil DNA glycosylase